MELTEMGRKMKKLEKPKNSGNWKPSRQRSVRLGHELDLVMDELAEERDMTFSAMVRVAIESYLANEVIRSELKKLESNIAATLITSIKETTKVADDIQLVIAFLDQFVKFQMFVEPEVIDKEGSAVLGNRRYNAFIDEFKNAFHIRRKRSRLVDLVEDEE